jgi:cellulose synthase/poly-beta-1,6-N-acetylglucosamine synthase-like glycosyltransferase
MTKHPKITIAVACLNEEKHIEECLNSLIAQDYPGEFDIFVADGGSRDKSLEIIQDFSYRYDKIKLIENTKKIQAVGRNLVFKNTDSEYLAYLDAHSYAERNWLSQLWREFAKRENKEKLGGVGSVHSAANKNDFPFAVSQAFNSPLGGGMQGSYSQKEEITMVDSAYACLYKKSTLDKIGYYDENLAAGEDLELNLRLKENGYSVYVNPKAKTNYYHKENFQDLIEQMYRYGFWRAKVSMIRKSGSNMIYVPSIFLVLLLATLILSFVLPILFLFFIALMIGYFLVIFTNALSNSITHGRNMFSIAMIYPCIHFGYGFGFLRGLLGKSGS